MLLILLALVTATLLALGALGACLPVVSARLLSAACVACAIGAVLAVLALLTGAAPVLLVLPVGLPGSGLTLALDGLSGWFLLLLFVVAAAVTVFAHDGDPAPSLPALVGAMALTLLAGDGFSILLGFGLMSLAAWGAGLPGDAVVLQAGIAAVAAFCLLAALALLVPRLPGGVIDLGFAAMRAAPPEGLFRAGAAVVLLIVGVGSQAGLVPLHVWLPPACAAAPAHVAALMAGAMTRIALYLLIRVLFDLAGNAPPLWWGMLLVTVGAGSAVLGALRANLAADLRSVLACAAVANSGVIAIGLGVALSARAADLTPLAALALGAALLLALVQALFTPLLFLAAGAVERGAATRRLSHLGGLLHRMPATTGCVLVGVAALASLPPGPAFAGHWLLFQSVFGAPRIGGLGVQMAFAVVAAALALSLALTGASAVRLVGVAFLGRPRTPRTVAAEEAGWWPRAAMIALAALTIAAGLLPGPLLALAEPALHQLLAGTMADRAGLLVIRAQADSPGYAAPVIAGVLGLVGVAIAAVLRRHAPRGIRRVPAWNGGFAASPAWLPFGDPLTQYGPASFSDLVRRSFAGVLSAREIAAAWLFAPASRLFAMLAQAADRVQFLGVRSVLTVMFAVLVMLLIAVAVMAR